MRIKITEVHHTDAFYMDEGIVGLTGTMELEYMHEDGEEAGWSTAYIYLDKPFTDNEGYTCDTLCMYAFKYEVIECNS